MAGVLQHLRSSTLDKRPNPASMVDGQVAINYASGAPGMFFKDSNGDLVKVGPVHVGSGAPNAVPASGGTAGNSIGEQWLDTSGGTYVFKIWDGSAWRSEAGEFVNVTGDTMTGALGIIAGSEGSPSLFISGDTDTGLYSPGANQLAISTNGTGRLFVDASGNVGVGASAVSNRKLTLDGGASYAIQRLTAAVTEFCKIEFGDSSSVAAGQLVYDNANDSLAIATNGSERLRIDSSGRLGLGTSSPSYVLDVDAGSSANALQLNSTNATFGVSANFKYSGTAIGGIGSAKGIDSTLALTDLGINSVSNLDLCTNYTQRVRIDSSGRVGIGITSPAKKLDVYEASTGDIEQYLRNTTINLLSKINGTTNAQFGTETSHPLLFLTGNTERASIDSSGRLLVGTSTARSNISTNLAPQFQIEGTDANTSRGSLIRNSNTLAAPALALGKTRGTSAGSNTIVQDNDGLGGIEFYGADGTNFVQGAYIYAFVDGTPGANDMPGRLVFSTTADGASSPTERMRIEQNGQVSFGGSGGSDSTNTTIFPSSGFGGVIQTSYYSFKAGTGAFMSYDPGSSVIFLRNVTNGVQLSSGGTSWSSYSDERLKTALVPIQNAFDKVSTLRAVTGRYKTDDESISRSFLIAQDVQNVLPEAIDTGNDELQTLSLRYTEVIPLLVAALKEAKEKIETLEAKVAALEGV